METWDIWENMSEGDRMALLELQEEMSKKKHRQVTLAEVIWATQPELPTPQEARGV